MEYWGKHKTLIFFVYSILAGVLLSGAFAPKLFFGIEWVALIPTLLFFFARISLNRLFFYVWIIFTVAHIRYLWWFFDSLPLDWLGLDFNFLSVFLVAIVIFITSSYLSLTPGLFFVIIKKYFARNFNLAICALILLWPFFEYIRILSYSAHPIFLGQGHLIGDNMGFMLLGYSIVKYTFVRGLTDVLGVYGISVVVLIPNVILMILLKSWVLHKKRFGGQFKLISALGLILIFLFFLGSWRYTNKPKSIKKIKVAILQTAIPTGDLSIRNKEDEYKVEKYRNTIQALASNALTEPLDLLIFPEATPSIFDKQTGTPYPSKEEIMLKIGSSSAYTVVIDGAFPPLSWNSSINSTTVFDNHIGVVGTYQKRFLMPFGEFTPFAVDWISQMFGFYWRDHTFAFKSGNKNGVFQTEFGKIGVLICSEILSPQLLRQTARFGAEILIFSSSDSIFRGSRALAEQNIAMAQIRSAEARKSLIYASNGGRSFVLSSMGDILWRSRDVREEIKIIEIDLNKDYTFATYILPW